MPPLVIVVFLVFILVLVLVFIFVVIVAIFVFVIVAFSASGRSTVKGLRQSRGDKRPAWGRRRLLDRIDIRLNHDRLLR